MRISDGIHVPLVVSQVIVNLLAPCSAVVPPIETYNHFTDLDYDRIQEVCEAGGTLNQTMSNRKCGSNSVPKGEYTWEELFLIKGYCYDNHALIHETDADALAVVLRRTEALLNYLTCIADAPDLSTYEQELTTLKTQSSGIASSEKVKRKKLYNKVCAVRRKIAFSNPLLADIDNLLFVEYDPNWGYGLHMCDQYYGCNVINGGGLYVLEDPFGGHPVKRKLLTGPVESGDYAGTDLRIGSFLSPEVSYDGNTVYFAWCEGKNPYRCEWSRDHTWHIFRVRADGTGLIQLTDGEGGVYWNEFDPCVLPNGRVAFLSERRTGAVQIYGRNHPRKAPVYTLYSMKSDGSDKYPLSYHEANQWHPSVNNNGMIVFTQWDYVDRGSHEAHHLWTCYPDGRDPRSPHGNYNHPWGDAGTPYNSIPKPEGIRNDIIQPRLGGSNLHPWGEWNIRAIPNSFGYIATAAAHYGVSFGSLVLINPHIVDDGMMSQVKRITPDCLFPQAEFDYQFACACSSLTTWDYSRIQYFMTGAYGTAWPLSEDFYICNYWKNIILLDRFGNKEVLYTVDWDNGEDYRVGFRPIDPMPLRPRRKPPTVPRKTFDGEDAPKNHFRATIGIRNIYETFPFPLPDDVRQQRKIKWMRIVQFIPKTTPYYDNPKVGAYKYAACRMSLGIVPVERDGSVFCDAPINKPIYFQALDENQMAIQSMRALTYVHSGEHLSCIGCHENKWKCIPLLGYRPIAFSRPPSPLQEEFSGHHTDPAKGAIPFNYHLLAKPALERAGYSGTYKCYWAPDVSSGWSGGPIGGSRSIPGYVGTHQSEIGEELLHKYKSGAISEEDFHRIVMWIDLNSNELGSYHDVEAQKAGRVVWPKIDVDRHNVLGTEHSLPLPDSAMVTARFPVKRDTREMASTHKDKGLQVVRKGRSLELSNLSQGTIKVGLWNALGSMVFNRTYNVTCGSIRIPVSTLPRGVYLLRAHGQRSIQTRISTLE